MQQRGRLGFQILGKLLGASQPEHAIATVVQLRQGPQRLPAQTQRVIRGASRAWSIASRASNSRELARTAASATEFELGLASNRGDQPVEDPVGRHLERAQRLHGGDPYLLGGLGILGQ